MYVCMYVCTCVCMYVYAQDISVYEKLVTGIKDQLAQAKKTISELTNGILFCSVYFIAIYVSVHY